MLDPPRFQSTLVKMHDFDAIIIPLYSFTNLPQARATELFFYTFLEATVKCTLGSQAESDLYDEIYSAFYSTIFVC